MVVTEMSKSAEGRLLAGRSFKEALVVILDKPATSCPDVVHEGGEVTWEVEIETEVMARLEGAYVGFIVGSYDCKVIQQNFLMDGFSNLKVIPFGHKKALLTSTVVGEVEELVGSVGWWCTWFEKFEAWSPNAVSNQRLIWLNCFGVPIHAWGEAIFRTIGFKFGTFVGVDAVTKNMERGDIARINILTDKLHLIDSSLAVFVLGKKFVIRIMEEVGGGREDEMDRRCCGDCARWREEPSVKGSFDGGSAMAAVAGSAGGGSDEGWS
jgi:hypothetical protein